MNSMLRVFALFAAVAWTSSCNPGTDCACSITPGLGQTRTWMYQLTGLEDPGAMAALVASPYDVVVIDNVNSVAGLSGVDVAADVTALKESGKFVLAYLNVGQAEDYRAYWQSAWDTNPPSWIAGDDPDGWDGNYPVYFWETEWRAILAGEIQNIVDAGFDGVYLDWLQIYEFPAVRTAAATLGTTSEDLLGDHIGWVRSLLSGAGTQRLFMVAQNTAELGVLPGYVSRFDAIAQEAIWFDGPGDPDTSTTHGDLAQPAAQTQARLDELAAWTAAGIPVFHVEYCEDPNNVLTSYQLGDMMGFRGLCALRLLDELTSTPPPWI